MPSRSRDRAEADGADAIGRRKRRARALRLIKLLAAVLLDVKFETNPHLKFDIASPARVGIQRLIHEHQTHFLSHSITSYNIISHGA